MDEWYYTTNNEQRGPVSWEKLEQLAASGRLKPSDMVWKDGMVDWVRADRKHGLFTVSPRPARTAEPADDDVDERPRRRTREDDDREDGERPRRRREADEDDEADDRPRRRRRKPAGMPLGAKVAIVGGSVMVGPLVLIVVIVLLVRGGGGPGSYTVRLQPMQKHTTTLRFNAGQNVSIRVTSSVMNPMCDVDLFVETAGGQRIAADVAIRKDCFVTFIAPATDRYRVSVANLGPGSATCVVNHQ
jgi:hypothetical protein